MRDHFTNARHAAAAALLAFAAAWPSLYAAFTFWAATPYERALQNAWCGDASDAMMMLGHCPACWIGVAMLASAALFVLAAPAQTIRESVLPQ